MTQAVLLVTGLEVAEDPFRVLKPQVVCRNTVCNAAVCRTWYLLAWRATSG